MLTLLDPTAHCTFRGTLQAPAIIATSNFDTSQVNIDSGKLIIDTGGPVRSITADADLNLFSSGELNLNGTGIDFVTTGANGIRFLSSVVFMANLPTSDPGTSGQLWNDSGTVKVS